jgi:hypothetical protein
MNGELLKRAENRKAAVMIVIRTSGLNLPLISPRASEALVMRKQDYTRALATKTIAKVDLG